MSGDPVYFDAVRIANDGRGTGEYSGSDNRTDMARLTDAIDRLAEAFEKSQQNRGEK